MGRVRTLTFVLLLAGCSSSPTSPAPARPSRTPDRGPRATAEAFIAALNALDTETAADLIAWDLYVAEDPALQTLVAQYKSEYSLIPPSPEDRARHPFEHSEITLGQLLDHPDPVRLLPEVAKAQFRASLLADFGGDKPRTQARLLAWFQSSREASATILWPNGKPREMVILPVGGRYRLLPRFRKF